MKNENYVLHVGENDAERLTKSDHIYGPGSRDFLKRHAHIKKGMKILDFGCGTGNMSMWMAEQVGPTGEIYGIDASAEQIEVAKARAESLGIKNITFLKLDFSQIASLGRLFDIAYCRFTLIHLRTPLEAIKLMASVTQEGGAVVCEEPITDLHDCSPENRAFNDANTLTISLGQAKGVDYNLGYRLHELFTAAQLSDITLDHFQPSIQDENDRGIFYDSFSQIADNLLDLRLSTTVQINDIREQLFNLKTDATYSIKGFCNIQAIGRTLPTTKENVI
jgi:SAM-dependent methyltransferase